MLSLLLFVVFTILSPFFLWVYYLAVVSLKRNAKNLEGLPFYAGVFILLIGYSLDAYVNVLIMTVVLREWPKEWTVTSRLKRHYKLHGTWGYRVAIWFIPFLEPYDPGHITNA